MIRFFQDKESLMEMIADMDQESKDLLMIDPDDNQLDEMETYIIEDDNKLVGFCGIMDAGNLHAELPIYIKKKYRNVRIAIDTVTFQQNIAKMRDFTHTAHSTLRHNVEMKALSKICGYKFFKSFGLIDIFVRPLGG